MVKTCFLWEDTLPPADRTHVIQPQTDVCHHLNDFYFVPNYGFILYILYSLNMTLGTPNGSFNISVQTRSSHVENRFSDMLNGFRYTHRYTYIHTYIQRYSHIFHLVEFWLFNIKVQNKCFQLLLWRNKIIFSGVKCLKPIIIDILLIITLLFGVIY